ncbi:MAG: HDOD domain-containing protein [Verrucomicrobia bacterium]|nr:HDOD domain-containing protein [Verrucomicrobiota bacterium]
MVLSKFSDAEVFQVAQELPAAPRLLVELGQLIRHPDTDSTEITALLRQDPSLVSRLIRMANSAVYARAEPAGSIEEALACIGFHEVHRLVGVVAAHQLSGERLEPYGIDAGRLRQNSLFVAVLMEEFARYAGEDSRSCYTVGLLRSLGKMALGRLADPDAPLVPFRASGELALDTWEQRSWGTTNCEIAERILLHWRLPHDTVVAIRHHYHPGRLHNPIIHLLNLAAGAAEHRCFGLPGEENFWQFLPDNFAKAGLTARDLQTAGERAQRTFQRLHSVVG